MAIAEAWSEERIELREAICSLLGVSVGAFKDNMGKNLKRQNDGPVLGTPGGASRHGGKAPTSIGGKRHKQMTLVPFLKTPAHVEETPALHTRAGKAGISSTGLHKLGQLNLRTQQKQQPSAAAPTQGRPAIPAEPQWQHGSPGSDDDFVISMSQTYERTQPEPCYDYGSAEQEEVELSLRRTQQYHPAGLTQPYSQSAQQHHDLLVATAAAAAALDNPDTAVATSTAADAWEASLAEASALGAPGPSALLLPPILEGHGSNQPGHFAALVAAAGVGLREGSRSGPIPILDLQRPLPALPALSGGHAQTPELLVGGSGAGPSGGHGGVARATVAEDVVADDGTTPPLQVGLPLFPIFTQGRVRRRPIHLIRHGESEYNVACKRRGGFGDPNDIFDARLTHAGEKQAKGLRAQLLDLMQQLGDPLFIVSPLSRAIETFLLMLPDPERLRICPQTPPPQQQPGAATARTSTHHQHHHHHHRPAAGQTRPQQQQQQQPTEAQQGGCDTADLASKPVNMLICPMLSEFLLTSGDVGRPRSALIESYPQIAEQLRKGLDKERWWYENSSKGPNCAISKQLNSTEPDKLSKARVDRFRQFVLSQSHRPIVVVGHANFFRTLTHDSHYMANCQMMSWAP